MKRCPRCDFFNEREQGRCGRCGGYLGERLVLRCRCGETYYAAEHQIGRNIRCSMCGNVFMVRPSVQTGSQERASKTAPPTSASRQTPRGGNLRAQFGNYAIVALAVFLVLILPKWRSESHVRPGSLP